MVLLGMMSKKNITTRIKHSMSLHEGNRALKDAREVLMMQSPSSYCIPGTPIWIVNTRNCPPHPSEVVTEYWDGSVKKDHCYRRNQAMKRALKKLKQDQATREDEEESEDKDRETPIEPRHKKKKMSRATNK